MDIHHYFHNGDEAIHKKLDLIIKQGESLMASASQMLADLQEANLVTNNIAVDVEALLAKLAAGGLSAAEATEVQSQIAALKDRLKGVAAKYDSGAVVDPGGDPNG